MDKINYCSLCGQPFAMVNEDTAEDKYVIWNNKAYCPNCYQDLTEQELKHLY